MENTKKDSENIYNPEDIDMLRLFYETLFKATEYHPHQMLNLLADTRFGRYIYRVRNFNSHCR